ncbi:unnamed protein product [Caenorhabditis brenneri]
MAQSVPPGDIQTQPQDTITFNHPYNSAQTSYLTVINSSARTIAYAMKGTSTARFGVDPPCGVLDPKKAVLLAVSCDAFAYGQEDTNNDRITIEWTDTPDGAAQQFRREWFQGNGMVRRKSLWIEYKGVKPENVDHQTTPEDPTQKEKSAEGSPELTLSSKLTHLHIRMKEAEEAQEKKEVEQKEKKKEAKEAIRSRSLPPRLSVHQFINILNPFVHATIPRKQCIRIDELLSERGLKRKNESIESRRLIHLTRNILYVVEETTKKHSYKTSGIINFSVVALLQNTKELLRQLGMENEIDQSEFIKLTSKPDVYQDKMYDYQKLVTTIEAALKEVREVN